MKSNRIVTLDLSGNETGNPSPSGEPARSVSIWEGTELNTAWQFVDPFTEEPILYIESIALTNDDDSLTITTRRDQQRTVIQVYDRYAEPEAESPAP